MTFGTSINLYLIFSLFLILILLIFNVLWPKK